MDDEIQELSNSQVQEQIALLHNEYPVVRLITKGDVLCSKCLLFEECGKMVAEELFDQGGGEKDWTLRLAGESFKATARYVSVAGDPRVLLCVSAPEEEIDLRNRHLLYIDTLTGAFNRRFYEDELRHQRIFAGVAVVDLDDFKLVNDSMGHHTGDLALQAAVKAMKRCVRDSDMLVRFGGDEFLLVMPNINQETFSRRLRAICEAVAQTPLPDHDNQFLSVSIGGVIANGETVESALQQADGLMYRAKNKKGCMVTDADTFEVSEFRKPLLLIVDDAEMNRMILREIIGDEYEVIEAVNGLEAVKLLQEHGKEISLVLLDIIMPKMGGFDVLSHMVSTDLIADVPVIMISSEHSDDAVLRAYELGASDYIDRPFDARVVRQRVSNTMRLYARQRRLSALLSRQYYERNRANGILLDIMGGVMDMHNGGSGSHAWHVRVITDVLIERLIAKTDKYDITRKDRSDIAIASMLHDIGKLAIPDNVINKPQGLTSEESEIMKTHTVKGADMLAGLDACDAYPRFFRTACEICRWHHERWDGGGYPDGLKGVQIPISAQVVSLADAYDALRSERVYKSALPHERVVEMILHGECGEFNPLLIECFEESSDRIADEVKKSECEFPPDDSKEKELMHEDSRASVPRDWGRLQRGHESSDG